MYKFASLQSWGERDSCGDNLECKGISETTCSTETYSGNCPARLVSNFSLASSPAPHRIPSSCSPNIVYNSLIREPVNSICIFYNCHSRDMMNPGVMYCTWQQLPQLLGTYASNLRISQIYMGIFLEISEASWYLTQKQTHLELKHFPLGSLAAVL